MQSTTAAGDDAAASIMDSLRRIVRALRVSAHRVERGPGVSGAQLFVLRELAAEPGCSIRRLSERTLTDPSSVSVVVARLVERSLVARRRDAADGRRTRLSLTARGERVLSRSREPFQMHLARVLRTLPRTRRHRLASDLVTVVRSLGAGQGKAPMFFDDEPRRVSRRGL